MTSRQRVRDALRHIETDRLPVDFGASQITGISAIAYRNLLDHLGVEEEVRVYDIKQQLALPSFEMIGRMGGDVAFLNRLAPTSGMPFLRLDRWKAGTLTDGRSCLVPEALDLRPADGGGFAVFHGGELFARRPPQALYFDVFRAPLLGAETREAIDGFAFPDPWGADEDAYLRESVERVVSGTELALFGGLPMMNCSFFELSLSLFGFEHFLMLMLEEPALVERWFERVIEHDFEILDRYLAIAGPHIDVLRMNDDMGGQEAMQISPETYRKLIKPYHRRWIEFVKRRTRAKVFLHSDGAIRDILPDLIEIGLDVLNPLQASARGMEPESLKSEFGADLCFWGGGVETQTTLAFGEVEDVRREVRERVAVLRRGGGYVFATVHNIQADIPPEKILAVFETALEC